MRRFARTAALVATTSLTLTGLSAVAPAAQAAPVSDPHGASTAATWLVKQLTNGIVHNNQYDFDDYGLTTDIGLGLDGLGGHSAEVSDIVDAMEPGAYANYYTSTFNGVTTTYAGQVAKLLTLVQQTSSSPTDYGNHDLVTTLEGTVHSGGVIDGRIEDKNNDFGDANVLGQAYAARALSAAGSSKAAAATAFLIDQQCPNGGFRLTFDASKTDSDQTCGSNSEEQLDVTSVAILALKAIGGHGTVVTDASNWLASQQQSSGAWGGDPGGSAANANSTGLAAWALGNTSRSADGATWLRDHQATGYDLCTKLRNQVGAVAYDAATLSSARTGGLSPASAAQDQFRRATAQALPGLQYLKSETPNRSLSISGPSGFLKAGSFQTFSVTGGVQGEELCLTSLGASSGSTVGASSPWRRALYMPSGSITRSVVAHDRDGHTASLGVTVLSAKRIGVSTTKNRFKRSSFARIYVYGLPYGEQVRIYFRGHLKASGTADAYGRFIRGIWTGRKLGKGTVHVYGQFADIRKGTKKIRVVR